MFTERAVGDEDLNTILEAANRAPSAHNQQSWRFIVLRCDKEQSWLSWSRTGRRLPPPLAMLLRMASRSIISAPVVMAVANTGGLIRPDGTFPGRQRRCA